MLFKPTPLSVHLGRTEKLTRMATTTGEEEESAGPGTSLERGRGRRGQAHLCCHQAWVHHAHFHLPCCLHPWTNSDGRVLEHSERRTSAFMQPLLFFCADTQTPSLHWGRTGGVADLVNFGFRGRPTKQVSGVCAVFLNSWGKERSNIFMLVRLLGLLSIDKCCKNSTTS